MSAPPLRARIGVCVDDFGLARGVADAALALADRGRVSAIACLVDAPDWPASAGALREGAAPDADIGLHLNLTENFGATSRPAVWPLRTLLWRAPLRALDRTLLRDAIDRQLDAFEHAVGRGPDFIDGHQHVQQLPVVRELLVDAVRRRYARHLPWLRRSLPVAAGDGAAARAKSWLIGVLGARALAAQCARAGIAQNGRLLGVYAFDGDVPRYRTRLQQWLALARDGDLLMCHPARATGGADPIAAARRSEYQLLAGPDWPVLLATAGVQVVRLSRLLTPP